MPIHQTDNHVVSTLYADLATARRAVESLRRRGITDDKLSIVTSGEHYDESYYREIDQTATEEADMASDHGLEAGAAAGGVGGLILGLGMLMVPGIGPILAVGGILTSTLAGAVVGGLAGGLIGLLAEVGVSEEKARAYAENLKRGRALVVVQGDASNVGTVADVLKKHEPIELRDVHSMRVG